LNSIYSCSRSTDYKLCDFSCQGHSEILTAYSCAQFSSAAPLAESSSFPH